MNAQHVTGRLLQSLSADKNALIDGYLLAFGVTRVGKYNEMPSVFKPTYEPEWEAFNKSFHLKTHGTSVAKDHLYRILEFVRYMQAIGFNPFATTVKHPRETKLSSTTKFKSSVVYEKIVESNLSDIAETISDLMRKNQLSVAFSVKSTNIEVLAKEGVYSLICSYVLVPKKKNESLDGVLTKLQGSLYNDSSAPIALRERKQRLPDESRLKPKVLNRKASALIKDASFFGWYPLRKTKNFNAFLMRAQNDCLVFKVLVHVELDVNLGAGTKNTLFKLWKTVSKTI